MKTGRLCLLGIVATCLLSGCQKQQEIEPDEKTFWQIHTEEEMIAADYLLYNVDCGNPNADTIFGVYQSKADQELTIDAATGKKWGYVSKDYMEALPDKYGEGLSDYRWEIKEGVDYDSNETGFYYEFEVPNGEYEVVLGFHNPFNARYVSAEFEGQLLVDHKQIFKYKLIEATQDIHVEDGVLDVKIFNPDRGKDQMQNPILSYITVRAIPIYNRELLLEYMESLQTVIENRENYTQKSYEAFLNIYEEAEQSLVKQDDDYRKRYLKVKEAYEGLEKIMRYSEFRNGALWKDDNGQVIQAHGGQVQRLTYKDKETDKTVTKWWWVGEDKSQGAHGGICAYSSDDLYNWHNEGVVMRNVNSREELETDDYFKQLYGSCAKEELDHIYECLSAKTAIIERPKMIYNSKTDMYVIWFHADGPTATSNSSYAAASAGVAVSKTPYGPFKFVERYRLNTCPEDQEDFYPQSKGMARDMNLFIDDDGTAYIIYSSEENLTLYISKLNDEYTYLATDPEKAVYGEDFIRLFPGAQREAPALFKRNGRYYLMSSGCTGWAPNQARFYMADSVLGEWENMGDPCRKDTKLTTFDTQSTCIFEVEEGSFIYMGDRWLSDDLANSKYIWLPVGFDEKDNMYLEYQEQWTY